MSPRRYAVTKRNKIDDAELVRLLVAEKWPQARIARHFNVSEAAVSQRLRLFGFRAIPLMADPNRGGSTVDAHIEQAALGGLDVATRLQELDRQLVAELDFLRERGAGNADKREALIEKLLATVSEIRKTSGTWLELARTMTAVGEVAMFRELVLRVLDEEAPAAKQRVLARLQAAKAGHRGLTPMLGTLASG